MSLFNTLIERLLTAEAQRDRSMAQTAEAIALGNRAADQAHKFRNALILIGAHSTDVEAVHVAKEALQ